MVACGGTDGANRDRPAQSAESARQTQQVTLTGCVQTGPASTTFVLENVRKKDAQRPVSPQSTQGEHAALITEGSWVRLRATSQIDPGQYIGQEVTVNGSIVDPGSGAIGTGGNRPGYTTPSGDRSLAATDKSAAEKKRQEAGPIGTEAQSEGTVPEVQIAKIEPTGKLCQAAARRDR
jgi:hypothetical protein